MESLTVPSSVQPRQRDAVLLQKADVAAPSRQTQMDILSSPPELQSKPRKVQRWAKPGFPTDHDQARRHGFVHPRNEDVAALSRLRLTCTSERWTGWTASQAAMQVK